MTFSLRTRPYRALAIVSAAVALWPTAMAAGPSSRRVVLLVPHHETYRAAAAECDSVLRKNGCTTLVLAFTTDGADAARAAPAQADSRPDGSQSPNTQPDENQNDWTSRLSAEHADLIIAFGERATGAALKSSANVPVLHSMISNVLDSPVLGDPQCQHRLAGVTTDFNPVERLNWIRSVQKDVSRVGVLHSANTVRTARSIQAAGERLGLKVVTVETSVEHFAEAIDSLTAQNCGAVLTIPDARVYQQASIKRLLLWGIRQKRGVWAFSENFVRAGALGGLCTDPAAIGKQSGQLALKLLDGTDPKSVGTVYPTSVQKALNERTAKLIGLSIPKDAMEGVLFLEREQ